MAKVFLADTTRWFIDGHAARPRERWTTDAPVKSRKREERRMMKEAHRRWLDN